jgi:Uri superfamily endonuclease
MEPVAGLGASDCDCETHLAYAPEQSTLAGLLDGAHDREFP